MKFTGLAFVLLTIPLAVFTQKASFCKLSGTVYDANGAVIVGASITATGEGGKPISIVTNNEGIYAVELPCRRYDQSPRFKASVYNFSAKAKYFQETEIMNFKLVPAYMGSMKLDIALDVVGVDPNHVSEGLTKGVALPSNTITSGVVNKTKIKKKLEN